jgi:L-asparaginase
MSSKRKVLVIYTGGTIGMMQDPETGVLAPVNFKKLRSMVPEVNLLGAELMAISFKTPIDSSDMNASHWQELALIIERQYAHYDGFVVLHGSDTMAYTASALSFMLSNLSKPVILTGSQLPIGVVRTDGRENVITAIEIASAYEDGVAMVPEVAIYFEYQLYRGNRTYKYNAEHFEAFRSPNYPVLAHAGVHIKYNRNAIRAAGNSPLKVEVDIDDQIAILTLYPGISQDIVRSALHFKHIKVVVLRTYGSGNAMTYPWFLDALREAQASGLLIINSSQCRAGGVTQGRYATSAALSEMGMCSAGDMMLEAVLTKSMHLLGQGLRGADFKRIFEEDMRGERTNA